jgi:hypothetical protein
MPNGPPDREKPNPAEWVREPKEALSAGEIFREVQAQHIRDMQRRGVSFLFRAYGFLIVATMAIIFLQGFRAWGFALEQDFLWWLGIAVIGEVGGLAGLVYGFFFKK